MVQQGCSRCWFSSHSCLILRENFSQEETQNWLHLLWALRDSHEVRFIQVIHWLITWVRRLFYACSHAALGHGPVISHYPERERLNRNFGVKFWSSDLQAFLICELWKYFGGLFSLLDGKLKPTDKKLVFLALMDPLKVGHGCHRSTGQKLKTIALKNKAGISGVLLMPQEGASFPLSTRRQPLYESIEFHGMMWPWVNWRS